MNSNTIFRIAKDVFSQDLDQETVLLDMKSEYYFGFNEIGSRIWQLVKTQHTLSEMELKLFSEFNADAATIEKDLRSLLAAALESGLIEIITTNE